MTDKLPYPLKCSLMGVKVLPKRRTVVEWTRKHTVKVSWITLHLIPLFMLSASAAALPYPHLMVESQPFLMSLNLLSIGPRNILFRLSQTETQRCTYFIWSDPVLVNPITHHGAARLTNLIAFWKKKPHPIVKYQANRNLFTNLWHTFRRRHQFQRFHVDSIRN